MSAALELVRPAEQRESAGASGADSMLRLLPGESADPSSFPAHEARYGRLPTFRGARERTRLLDELERSGLGGRGGAGFPTATKLRAVAKGRNPMVVANGTEGEPASTKDATLIAANPQLVLDGALAAADAVGADEIILAVSRAAAHASLTSALASRSKASSSARVTVALVPERFLAGEESALVHVLNGGPSAPTSVPPRPFERGVRGRPTLVQNVETLANIALIARGGAEWFRRVGTPEEPGSVLVSVLGAVARPGVFELPLGTPLAEIFARAGGFSAPPRALLVGGYFGSWVDAACVGELALSRSSLAFAGAALGARTLAVLPDGVCGVAETARVTRYLSDQSAGQCGPCLFGLCALAGALESVARSAPEAASERERLPRLAAQIARRGACSHPDGTLSFVESATRVFARELSHHLHGRCSQGHERGLLPLGADPTAERSRR